VTWVDIPVGSVLQVHGASEFTRTRAFGPPVSATLRVTDGVLLLAQGSHLLRVGPEGEERVVAKAPLYGDTRLNDATCDPLGRVWIGSMSPSHEPIGALYRRDPGDRVLEPVGTGVTVSNGIGFSPDASRLFYIDSPTRRIDVFDYDLRMGSLRDRRTFAQLPAAWPSVPDGLAVDADGCVWVAIWGGWSILRFGTDGSLDRALDLPVEYPTSCCFLDTELIVTSASRPVARHRKAHRPLDGRRLRIGAGVRGAQTYTTTCGEAR
jgi:sugar lactone lactonase YvrE